VWYLVKHKETLTVPTLVLHSFYGNVNPVSVCYSFTVWGLLQVRCERCVVAKRKTPSLLLPGIEPACTYYLNLWLVLNLTYAVCVDGRWSQHVLPKRWYATKAPHCVTTRKTSSCIFAVRTSDLALRCYVKHTELSDTQLKRESSPKFASIGPKVSCCEKCVRYDRSAHARTHRDLNVCSTDCGV
jgi:hypothetical protein